ncbi:SCO2583 family membrane protein [Streptomyces sp. 24-1644]|uniref:SCO2583 family membrane protein n=1 Tax=Streptomyces sp. 24-1644 TaxID=3457315 RepID=UPI003FA79FFB
MTGRGEPPEDPPENPAGGEDEYRSLVFDESFVRAARLQEFSAQERMGDHAHAVRSLPGRAAHNGSKAVIALVVLIALAFATAVYIGFRHPYPPPTVRHAQPLKSTVVPLTPQDAVPSGTPTALYAASPAAEFRTGAEGINLPAIRRTHSFSESQVTAALTTVKDYLVGSSLDADVLTGTTTRPVERLLDPDQTAQFDRSMSAPVSDGRHSATGWLVRFDPEDVELADPKVRVQGTLAYAEAGADTLEVVSDHTFTYALRPVVSGPQKEDGASLFTVRRELHFQFDREDLRLHRLEVRTAHVQAGPQACSAETAGALVPLLAGERADNRGPAGTDPYATGPRTAALCGTLAVSSGLPRNLPPGPAADGSPARP